MLYIRSYCLLLLLIIGITPGTFALRKIPVAAPHLRNALTDYSPYIDSPVQVDRTPEHISLADEPQYKYGKQPRPHKPHTPVRYVHSNKPVGVRLLNASIICFAIGVPLTVLGEILLNNRNIRGLIPIVFGVPLVFIGLGLAIPGLILGTRPSKKGS